MYHTCLHCTRDLGQNDVVELLPIGRRIAFDAARGRLWVVCRSCGKWNLVPFDHRLEAIDACEKLFHDTRKRFSTEQIGMARMADGTDLVRIGEPQRPEFASWRYGEQYKRRRRVNLAYGGGGFLATQAVVQLLNPDLAQSSLLLGVAASAGIMLAATSASTHLQNLRLRVLTTLPSRPGVVKIGLHTGAAAHLRVHNGEMSVLWPSGFSLGFSNKYETVSGPGARLLARRVLGVLNRDVGSKWELSRAIERVGEGDVEQWISRLPARAVDFLKSPLMDRQRLAGSQTTPWIHSPRQPIRYPHYDKQSFLLASLPRPDRLAIEMWLSEEDEARALSGELALLERQWKEAEELAAIADGLAIAAVVEP